MKASHTTSASHGSTRPTLAFGTHLPQVVLMTRVDHFCVGPRTELGVVLEKLLVAKMQQVALRIVETRIDILVQLPIPLPQLHVEVRSSLA